MMFSLTFSLISSILISVVSLSPALEKALEAAGDNRPELEKVLKHYEGDPQKHDAAVFLIENMEGHCYVTYVLHDTAGDVVPFDVLSYPNYDSLEAAVRIIEDNRGELDYRRDERFDDLPAIQSDFLINHIDYAFRAWKEKPWAKGLNFEQFCEYVLPYRGSNEPLEEWREFFWLKYENLETAMANPSDPLEAASLINDDVKSWFKFDPRYYYHPTDQGLADMLKNKMGRCEDMTNLTIYAMRANGLAVTSDYTPYWANSGNNHAWNAIVTGDGKVVPFMGAEANPGQYRLANKLAKVYRKTYSVQPQNLIFQDRKQENVPRWLAGKNYVDVTSDYVTVSDVVIKFEEEIADSVDIAYLCVFNSGDWKAIHWGRIVDGTAVFTDMGTGIAYLPALYLNDKIAPFGPPFILKDESQVQYLSVDRSNMLSVKLTATTARKQEISTDGVATSTLQPGQSYELFYWDNDWQPLGASVAGDTPLTFENIPANGLYWLVAEGSDKEERIFTIEDDQQVWW
ncbi:MAG: transglutaminase domain-containing protein [Candidatus Zixiibacteriota bacterium]|nr:MAG: transglutaminase domain-containing protein [candidate division Zixibacteria bacterium]